MRTRAPSKKKDDDDDKDLLRQQRKDLEQRLVDSVCHRIRWLAALIPGVGATVGLLSGEDLAHTFTPGIISLTALFGGLIVKEPVAHATLILVVLALAVGQHAILLEGCSASIVPHCVYGLMPCLTALLYRSPQALIKTTLGVVAALTIIYATDLSGYCPSDSMDPSNQNAIVEHRLIPAMGCILASCALLTAVVRQSQESIEVHAEAAKAAENLAILRHDLLHRITHELRTPLHGIVGSVELLLASQNLSQEDRENTELIQQCLQSIVGTCDNVLLATNSSSASNTKKSIFSLSRCVDDVIEAFSQSAEAKGIELRLDFRGDTKCMVRGMENQLLMVLRNLLSNGIKYTDEGHVTLRVLTSPNRSKSLRCKFEVEDTGHGIDPEESRMLFEAFHQAERNAVSRQYKGAGLGLTIVRELVQIMGGSIDVESQVGQGTTFSFELILRNEPIAKLRTVPEECQGEIVILDSQTESRNSCLSVLETVAASQIQIRAFSERSTLLQHVADTAKNREHRHIAILECGGVEDEFRSLVDTLSNAGWFVFAYCDQTVHARLQQLTGCSSASLRPLSLVGLEGIIYNALVGPQEVSSPSNMLKDELPSAVIVEEDKDDETDVEFARDVPVEIEIVQVNTSQTPTADCKPISVPVPVPIPARFPVPPAPESPQATPTKPNLSPLALPSGSQILVVDDTPLNVKVLTKILSRLVSVPVVSLYSGQAAIDFVDNTDATGPTFVLMDFHMPSVCGLTASAAIRSICERNGHSAFISIVTADIEGLYAEMKTRHISYKGTVSRGVLTRKEEDDTVSYTSGSLDERSYFRKRSRGSSLAGTSVDDHLILDLVAGKPLTIQSVETILKFFRSEWAASNRETLRQWAP